VLPDSADNTVNDNTVNGGTVNGGTVNGGTVNGGTVNGGTAGQPRAGPAGASRSLRLVLALDHLLGSLGLFSLFPVLGLLLAARAPESGTAVVGIGLFCYTASAGLSALLINRWLPRMRYLGGMAGSVVLSAVAFGLLPYVEGVLTTGEALGSLAGGSLFLGLYLRGDGRLYWLLLAGLALVGTALLMASAGAAHSAPDPHPARPASARPASARRSLP
jgi:hypothetical protein